MGHETHSSIVSVLRCSNRSFKKVTPSQVTPVLPKIVIKPFGSFSGETSSSSFDLKKHCLTIVYQHVFSILLRKSNLKTKVVRDNRSRGVNLLCAVGNKRQLIVKKKVVDLELNKHKHQLWDNLNCERVFDGQYFKIVSPCSQDFLVL